MMADIPHKALRDFRQRMLSGLLAVGVEPLTAETRAAKRKLPEPAASSMELREQKREDKREGKRRRESCHIYGTPQLHKAATAEEAAMLAEGERAACATELFAEPDDAEYTDARFPDMGKYLEYWLADSIACPACGARGSLRLFLSPNFPVYDLLCVDPGHGNDYPRAFQVKASFRNAYALPVATSPLPGGYSDAVVVKDTSDKRIVHGIRTGHPSDVKDIVPAYICIYFVPPPAGQDWQLDKLKIRGKDSYCLLPRLNHTGSDELYYYYDNGVVKWNALTVEKRELVSDDVVDLKKYMTYYSKPDGNRTWGEALQGRSGTTAPLAAAHLKTFYLKLRAMTV